MSRLKYIIFLRSVLFDAQIDDSFFSFCPEVKVISEWWADLVWYALWPGHLDLVHNAVYIHLLLCHQRLHNHADSCVHTTAGHSISRGTHSHNVCTHAIIMLCHQRLHNHADSCVHTTAGHSISRGTHSHNVCTHTIIMYSLCTEPHMSKLVVSDGELVYTHRTARWHGLNFGVQLHQRAYFQELFSKHFIELNLQLHFQLYFLGSRILACIGQVRGCCLCLAASWPPCHWALLWDQWKGGTCWTAVRCPLGKPAPSQAGQGSV